MLAGVAVGAIHIISSRALRGKSMPVDAVEYITVLTLIVFILFRIPSVGKGVNFSRSDTKSNKPAGGTAAIVFGLLTLAIQHLMGSTHTWDGINYAKAFNTSMIFIGFACLLFGAGLIIIPDDWNMGVKHANISDEAF